VLIPEQLVEHRDGESEQRVRHLLLHELTHLKQGDIWLAWLWTLALAVQWFNPIFWLLERWFRFDCESACDDRVLTTLAEHERADYGTSLLHILIDLQPAAASTARPRRVPGSLGVVETRIKLERRLTMMDAHRTPSWTRRLSACVVFLLLAALCLTSYGQSKPTTTAPAKPAAQATSQPASRPAAATTRRADGERSAPVQLGMGASSSYEQVIAAADRDAYIARIDKAVAGTLSDEQKRKMREQLDAIGKDYEELRSRLRIDELTQAMTDARASEDKVKIMAAQETLSEATGAMYNEAYKRIFPTWSRMMVLLTPEQRVAWRTSMLADRVKRISAPVVLSDEQIKKFLAIYADQLKDDELDPGVNLENGEVTEYWAWTENRQQVTYQIKPDDWQYGFKLRETICRVLTDAQKDTKLTWQLAQAMTPGARGDISTELYSMPFGVSLSDEQLQALIVVCEDSWKNRDLSQDDRRKLFVPFVGTLSAKQKDELIQTPGKIYVKPLRVAKGWTAAEEPKPINWAAVQTVEEWIQLNQRQVKQNAEFRGQSLVHFAATSDRMDVLEHLKEQGADFNVRDKHGNTPMHEAARYGRVETMKWLKEQGADLKIKNDGGSSLMYTAAEGGKLAAMQWLKKQGLEVNVENKYGDSIMFAAARGGNVEVMEWLKDQGVEVHVKKPNGETPMFNAAQVGRVEVMKWLKDQGAEANVTNNNGETPMFRAAGSVYAQLATMKWLNEQGVDVNAVDKGGQTAMFKAAWSGNIEAMEWLKAQGAKVNVRDKSGRTIADMARDNKAKAWLRANGAGKEDDKETFATRSEARLNTMPDFTREFLLRHFDADGDGKLDEKEWKAVSDFTTKEFVKTAEIMESEVLGGSDDRREEIMQRVWPVLGKAFQAVSKRIPPADGAPAFSAQNLSALGNTPNDIWVLYLMTFEKQALADNGGKPGEAVRAAMLKAFETDMRERIKKAGAKTNGKLGPDEAEKLLTELFTELGLLKEE